MFSIADMAVAGAVALLLFGPDQLPKVARRAGQLVRDVQNTSQSFIREMERAADTPPAAHETYVAPGYPEIDKVAPPAPTYHEAPEPASHELVVEEAALVPHPAAVPPLLPAPNHETGLPPAAQTTLHPSEPAP